MLCIQGRAAVLIPGMRDSSGIGGVVAMADDLRVRLAVLIARIRGGGNSGGVVTMS